MVKCVMVVLKNKSAATQHTRVLNPHLEHAAFDAIFTSEHTDFKYSQGHCQVSSFGVGGTNGHAIFWGKDLGPRNSIDVKQLFFKKLDNHKPTLLAAGPNPADWDFSGPDFRSKPGDKYSIIIEKDPITGATPIRWEKDSVVDKPEFYSITGNHNEWSDDRMEEGDVPHLFFKEVTLPSSGSLEFRFLLEGDARRAWGPIQEVCTRRTAPFGDVTSDCSSHWRVTGASYDRLRIELFAPPSSPPSVTWFKVT
jgi:hypothetical protein